MSDPYLLAAGLLTAGPLSAPPPPLPPILPNNLSALLASIAAKALSSVEAPTIVPLVETTFPEFSQPQPSPVLIPVQDTTKQKLNLQPEFKPPSTVLSPTSGSQLYQQRLTALKAGKLYTRLPADSFQSVWAKGTVPLQQPTHEQWIRLLEQEAKA
ncbi:MAG: acylhydrolase, partial [Coleofasciculus sp. S288]|nr:acylhydrolase [Coleofasciculus sp. S288]